MAVISWSGNKFGFRSVAYDVFLPFQPKVMCSALLVVVVAYALSVTLAAFIASAYFVFTLYANWETWLYRRSSHSKEIERQHYFNQWLFFVLFYHFAFVVMLKLIINLLY